MPFKSKAQMRLFGAKESKGELPKGTTHRWAEHTKSTKKLPEHVKKSEVASHKQVDVFVKAAMARYAELGVPKDIAEELFARKMTKIAEQLGMALPEDPSQRIVKLATAKLTAKGIPEAQARVMLTHEFSKQAFIEKVARVKKSLMVTIKAAQAANATPATLPANTPPPSAASGLPRNAANTPVAVPKKTGLSGMGLSAGTRKTI